MWSTENREYCRRNIYVESYILGEAECLVRANCHNLGNPWVALNPPDKLQTWLPALTFIE